MKVLKNLNLLLLLTVLILSSCKKDNEINNNGTSIKQIPEVLITSSISGTVVNEDGTPIENVMVRLGANTSATDGLGVFSFNNIEMNQNGALISVEEEGYFKNTKVVLTKTNETSITKIMLIEKVITSTFPASEGTNTTMNGGAKLVIPAQGVKLESGGAYDGNVNVYATWLDPTADDLNLRMPGDLRGNNADNEDVKLETYGMIGVELEGENGEALNIADGQTATIEVPVPAALLGSAPATILLWHFDEATGYWVEEGEATLTSDNTYIGSVSHFSFWNYDVPYLLIHIEGIIADENENGLSDLEVVISMNSSGEAGYGYTNSNGLYEGYVPKDEELTITVFDNCWEEIYTAQIGPFANDAVVPTIYNSNFPANFLTVIGVLNDCDNQTESEGYVHLTFGGYQNSYLSVDMNGNFNSTINVCDQIELSVSGISTNPFSQGTTTVHDISGLSELNVGTLTTCW